MTKENLSVIDRQIAAASTASNQKSKKRLSEPEPERNAKKPRVDHPEAKVILHKAKVIITYGRADKRRAISLTPQKASPGKVKQDDPVGVAEKFPQTQPRANNGRFAKKFKIASVLVQNKTTPFSTPSPKRRNEEMEDLEESPRKKSANADKEDEGDLPMIQKVRRASGFHAGRLFSRPNPQQFALRAWSNRGVPDDSSVSSEDDTNPITPEDNLSSGVDIVDPGEAEINSFSHPRARASLSCLNPSPHVYAKNRWNAFGQTVTTPNNKLSRRLSLDELYISEAEVCVRN